MSHTPRETWERAQLWGPPPAPSPPALLICLIAPVTVLGADHQYKQEAESCDLRFRFNGTNVGIESGREGSRQGSVFSKTRLWRDNRKQHV